MKSKYDRKNKTANIFFQMSVLSPISTVQKPNFNGTKWTIFGGKRVIKMNIVYGI